MSKKIKDRTVNILGTPYTVSIRTQEEDNALKGLSGYCVTLDKLIVAEHNPHPSDDSVMKRTLRHEIIHAFLFESGLDNEAPWAGHEEELVDWMAIQFPKMVKAMKEMEAL